jgi:hypothetical protein
MGVSLAYQSSDSPVEGSIMRIFVALAAVAASVALAGCFHHTQQVYTAELPTPVEVPPYK